MAGRDGEQRTIGTETTTTGRRFRAGVWHIDVDACRIVHEGSAVKLSPRSTNVLAYLAARPGETVTHDELLAQFWRGAVSSTNAVHKAVAELRHAFASRGDGALYVETVPKRGYRLVVPVEPIHGDAEAMTVDAPVSVAPPHLVRTSDAGAERQPARPSVRSGAVRRWAGITLAAAVVAVTLGWLMSRYPSEATAVKLHDRTAVLLPVQESASTDAERHLLAAIVGGTVARFHAEPTATTAQIDRPLLPSSAGSTALGWPADYTVELRVKVGDDKLMAMMDSVPADPGRLAQHVQIVAPADSKDSFIADAVARIADDLAVLLDDAAVAQMREWGTGSVLAYRLAREGDSHQRINIQESQESAAALFRAAIEADPDFDYAIASLAYVYYTIGSLSADATKAQDARRELQALLRHGSTRRIDPFWRDRIAGWYEALSVGTVFDAEALWRQALLRDPSDDEALLRYSELLRGAGLFSWVVAYRDSAIARAEAESDHPTVEYLSRSRSQISAWAEGDLEAWLALSKRAVEEYLLDDAITLYGIVEMLGLLGRLQEAEHYAARLKRADPVWGHAAELNIRVWRGDLELGSAELAAVLADDTVSHSQRGAICFQLGDVECGVQHWRRIEPPFLRLEWSNLATLELYWRPGVTDDPRYQALLEELGIGRKWRAHLKEQAAELAKSIGISLPADPAAAGAAT